MNAEAHTFDVDDHLPQLVINYPTCSHCGNDVTIEDGYPSCDTCHVTWDQIDDAATATPDPDVEGSDVPCELKARHADQAVEYDHDGKHWSLGPKRPCILPSGHESDCLHPHTITTTPLEVTS